MARKSDGEKIDELKDVCAALTERLAAARKDLDTVSDSHQRITGLLAELQRQSEKEIALLNREIEDLKKSRDRTKTQQDEQARRLWAFGPNLLAAVVSGIIAFFVAYLTAHR